MPIRPPAFNVPALSPASLLGGRQPQDDSFERALQQGMNFFFNQQLQQAGIAAQQQLEETRSTNRQEESFTGALAGGNLTPVEEARTFFPGETIPESFTVVQGPPGTRFEGQGFVRTGEVQAHLEGERLGQVIDDPDIRPGTTIRQFEGTRGTPTSAEERARFRRAPEGIEAVRMAIESFPDEDQRRAARAAFENMLGDDFLSESEAGTLREDFGITPQRRIDYEKLLDARDNAAREVSASIRRDTREIMETRQKMIDPQGEDALPTIEPFSPREAQLVATLENNPGALTEEERAEAVNLQRLSHAKTGVIDRVKSINDMFKNAGNPSSPRAFVDAVDWVLFQVERNDAVREELADVLRGVSRTDIEGFLQAETPLSRSYRAAFALQNYSKREVLELQRKGAPFEFGLDGLFEKMEMIEPGWNDVATPPRGGGGVNPGQGLTAEETQALVDELRASGEEEAFVNTADEFMNEHDREMLATALLNDDPDRLLADLYSARQGFEITDNAAGATVVDTMIRYLEMEPEKFLVAADSIYLPALGFEGR